MISVDENCEIYSSDYYGDDYLPLKNLFNDMYAKDNNQEVFPKTSINCLITISATP